MPRPDVNGIIHFAAGAGMQEVVDLCDSYRRLESALRKYADPNNWTPTVVGGLKRRWNLGYGPEVAQEALEKESQ
jgi:hypothetical protein